MLDGYLFCVFFSILTHSAFVFSRADISRSGDYDGAYEEVVHWLEATNRKLEINKDVKGSLVAITERLRNVQEISRSVETGKDKYNK